MLFLKSLTTHSANRLARHTVGFVRQRAIVGNFEKQVQLAVIWAVAHVWFSRTRTQIIVTPQSHYHSRTCGAPCARVLLDLKAALHHDLQAPWCTLFQMANLSHPHRSSVLSLLAAALFEVIFLHLIHGATLCIICSDFPHSASLMLIHTSSPRVCSSSCINHAQFEVSPSI